MKTEVYTCDICKQSKSCNDLCSLDIQTRGITLSQNKYAPHKHFDICKDCLKKRGFVVEAASHDEAEEGDKKNDKLLESKILDILEDLGVAFVD